MPTTPAPSTTTSNSWLAISDLLGCTRAGTAPRRGPPLSLAREFRRCPCGFALHRRREQAGSTFQSVDVCAVLLPEGFRGGFPFGARPPSWVAESLPRAGICGVAEPPSIPKRAVFGPATG